MTYLVDLQIVASNDFIPSQADFERWVSAALKDFSLSGEITIRIVDQLESAYLNETYRKKSGATNILSFPFENDEELATPLFGDLVVCAEIVAQQAQEQARPIIDHWAHLIVHGVLHLLGYDHIQEQEAIVMETFEVKILHELGYEDPYGERELYE